MNKEDLEKYIDCDLVMKLPRYACGHEEIMKNIFGNNAKVIAEYIEDDYQGTEAFAYQFKDGSIVIATDYFGSCSGCDSWEDATDEDAKRLIIEIVSSSRLFVSLEQAIVFCKQNLSGFDYPFKSAYNLLGQLKELF